MNHKGITIAQKYNVDEGPLNSKKIETLNSTIEDKE